MWSDPRVDWASYAAVVLRSTWDYTQRLDEFLAWAERVGALTQLWNPASVVRWNSHKSYLLDLDRAGVPVVPTRVCADLPSALAAVRASGWSRAVVKPAVSAAGRRTFLIDAPVGGRKGRWWRVLSNAGQLLAQPYLEEVERSGERSLVYFRGRYSHAFLRAPHLASGSHLQEGARVLPTRAEREVGHRTMACLCDAPLYARVDVVADATGSPRLMELEAIEPFLGLSSSAPAAARFARAIARSLQEPPWRGSGSAGRV